ncbi:MAG: ABC transporter substrate-binding protein, partial [Flavobacteriales bacterium]|nr:ABC transporter substrate-binding protein [Flavobacteriales bacterium]
SYLYIGINQEHPILKSKNVRQAMAWLIDVDRLIASTQYGMATPTVGPIPPFQSKNYNADLTRYTFDLEKAKKLLKEDGWEDSNNNGILDKKMNGKQTELELSILINAGHENRKLSGLLFQEDLAKAGIKLNLDFQESRLMFSNQLKGDFELCIGAWGSDSAPFDGEQLFHSSQIGDNKFNYTGFSNKLADQIMDSTKFCLDEGKRALLYKRLQEVLHEELPYIFLFNPTNKIILRKDFANVYTSSINPGFRETAFLPK